jgi:hypothetical protein
MSSRCRLSLSDIPHGYEHCLEVDADSDTDEKDDTHENKRQGSKGRTHPNWPDGYAVSFLLFMLFILNATILNIWLGILSYSGHPITVASCTDVWRIIIFCVLGGCILLNLVFTWFAKAHLGSRVLTFASGIFALAWCILLTVAFTFV